jgi:hypothetical protein
MKDNDCAGYKQMLENMQEPGKYPLIVNEFNETGPVEMDLKFWATKEYFSNRLKLI